MKVTFIASDFPTSDNNHAPFVAELNANGLPNAYETFNWKAAKR